MNIYGGAGIEAFANAIREEFTPKGPRDWSMELAYHLAGALISLQRMNEEETQTTYRRGKLVEPALDKAWRELIFIRQRYVSEESVLNDIARRVTLSKLGRITIDDSEDQNYSGGSSSDIGISSQTRQRLYRKPHRPRYRRRRLTKPYEPRISENSD